MPASQHGGFNSDLSRVCQAGFIYLVGALCVAAGVVACASGIPVERTPQGAVQGGRRELPPPPPPCTSAAQFERARARVQPDSVMPPVVVRMYFLPEPRPRDRPVNTTITVRVDSIGRLQKETIDITGIRYDDYRQKIAEVVSRMEFRPAVLMPDRCSVPGTGWIRMTHK